MIANGGAFNTSDYFGYAQSAAAGGGGVAQAGGERLPEYSDARLPRLEQALSSKEPHYDDFEVAQTRRQPDRVRQRLRRGRPAGASKCWPASRRASARYQLVSGTKLKRPGGPQEALRGRPGGDRRGQRPDDRARQTGRRPRPARSAKNYETKIDEPKRQRLLGAGQGPLRARRREQLPRRDVHAAAERTAPSRATPRTASRSRRTLPR